MGTNTICHELALRDYQSTSVLLDGGRAVVIIGIIVGKVVIPRVEMALREGHGALSVHLQLGVICFG